MDKRKDLTYEEIERLGQRYKLDVHATVNSTFVKSSKDNWLICNEEDGYILYHENTRKQYKYKGNFNHGYHFQRAFPSIRDAFKYILRHDEVRYTDKERSERRKKQMLITMNNNKKGVYIGAKV